jgi:hypothetical protein
MKKTYKDVIEETVQYYSENERGISGLGYNKESRCVYKNADGAMCAVGRCLTDAYLEKVKDINGDVYDLFEVSGLAQYSEDGQFVTNEKNIVLMMKEEYSELTSLRFWKELQHLHDTDSYWISNSKGYSLTEKGVENLNYLLVQYGQKSR